MNTLDRYVVQHRFRNSLVVLDATQVGKPLRFLVAPLQAGEDDSACLRRLKPRPSSYSTLDAACALAAAFDDGRTDVAPSPQANAIRASLAPLERHVIAADSGTALLISRTTEKRDSFFALVSLTGDTVIGRRNLEYPLTDEGLERAWSHRTLSRKAAWQIYEALTALTGGSTA